MSHVSSALDIFEQRQDPERRTQRERHLGGTCASFGLTTHGLRRAALQTETPVFAHGTDFNRGMDYISINRSQPANSIHPGVEFGDPVDENGRPVTWEPKYLGPIHGAWIVGHHDDGDWRALCSRVSAGLEEVGVETGETRAREPFGFLDASVQHAFFEGQTPSSWWADLPLRSVIVVGNSPHAGGSYLVFRKLEQDVDAFRSFETMLRNNVPAALYGGRDPGALLIGRDRDGNPLVDERPSRRGSPHFGDDRAGRVCPLHAHIRKANPRDGLPREAHNIRAAQFVRRSVVYEQPAAGNRPAACGLLFLGYMRNVGSQFLVQQKTWMINPEFPKVTGGNRPGVDPLALYGASNGGWTWNHGGRNITVDGLNSFVTPRGGVYLYIPAKSWLNNPRP